MERRATLAPQKRQCEFGSYYPAGTLVKPLPRQAAGRYMASLFFVSLLSFAGASLQLVPHIQQLTIQITRKHLFHITTPLLQ